MLEKFLDWSQKEFSELPWRRKRSLYRTLVSEIMLQQTTVSTVKNHFERFLTQFPTLESLAAASEDEMLVAWKGLGYYRRAKNLKKIAEALVNEHQGEFPHDMDTLQTIPGIGPYTANAIVGIGMDKKALAVDANLERVIARFYGLKTPKGPKLQKEIQKLFVEDKIFTQKVSYRALNEALMDLGRTYCQARKASCELCWLKKECVSFNSGNPLLIPVEDKKAKKTQEHELDLLRIYVVKKSKLLVYKKDDDEWLSGQYEVPSFVLHSTDHLIKQYPHYKNKFDKEGLLVIKTGITKYKIRNYLLKESESGLKKFGFIRKMEWREISAADANFSTATIKGLEKLDLL